MESKKSLLYDIGLVLLSALACVLLLTGCPWNEAKRCYSGLTENDVPNLFVLVERADASVYYTASENDRRLMSIDERAASALDDDGRYIESWPSCHGIDGFDEVDSLTFESVTQLDSSRECKIIKFSAKTNVQSVSVVETELDWHWTLSTDTAEDSAMLTTYIYPLRGALNVSAENPTADWTSPSYVFISYAVKEGIPLPYKGRAAFQGKGKAGDTPPFVLIRARKISGDDLAKAAELWGVDMTGVESYDCADMYYGYFAED